MSMRIECPDCSQRFTVESSLDGKMVECGSCDNRFLVSEEVLVDKTKTEFRPSLRKEHAPGEEPIHASVAGSLKPKKKPPEVDYQEPTKPSQILAGIAGLALTAVIWIVFIFGSRVGGALKDVDINKRYVLAGSFCAVIFFLFFLSSKRNRLFASVLGLIFGGSLLLAPSLFPVYTTPDAPENLSDQSITLEDSTPVQVDLPLESERPLAERVGSKAMEAAWGLHGRNQVLGIMVSGVDDKLLKQVRLYLQRKLLSSELPMLFDRDSGCLMVVAPTKINFEEAQHIIKEIGKVTEVDSNKRLIAINVTTDLFDLPPSGILLSPSSPDFYRLNARELKAFDHNRVMRAAERLKGVEPNKLRGDIRGRLISKINSVNDAPKNFYSILAEALIVWADDEDPEAVAAVEYAVQKSDALKIPINRELLVFLLRRNSAVGHSLLYDRWSLDPSDWEVLYLQIPRVDNQGAFKPLLRALTEGTIGQKRSAAALLGSIGGKNALKVLKDVSSLREAKEDIEFKVQLKNSIEAIERRLASGSGPNSESVEGGSEVPPLPDPD